jgi:hypothetical protein
MMFSAEVLKMLHDFRSWNSGKDGSQPISIFDYLCFTATPDALFAFASLFFIELIKYEDVFFIKERFDERVYREWKKRLDNVVEIQRAINHIHISQIFQNQDVDDELAFEVANLIQKIWSRVFAGDGLIAEVHGETAQDISITLVSCG